MKKAYRFQVTVSFRSDVWPHLLGRRIHWLGGLIRRALRQPGISFVAVEVTEAREQAVVD